MNRRDVLRLVPTSSLAWLEGAGIGQAEPAPRSDAAPLLAGPPVVQHLTTEGFAVSFAVGQLATGWVEWGPSAEQLDQRAVASRAGLVRASDRALVTPVSLDDRGTPGRRIFYRVVAQALSYQTAYKLRRGEPLVGPTRSLMTPIQQRRWPR